MANPNLQRKSGFYELLMLCKKSVSRAERINQALQTLYLVGAGLLNAVAVQLTTLPVVEGKAANIGDGVLALGHLQTAEPAGEVVVLAIAAVVLHLRKLVGVNQRGSGGRKKLCTRYLLYCTGAQPQCQNQCRNQFLHTRWLITYLRPLVKIRAITNLLSFLANFA